MSDEKPPMPEQPKTVELPKVPEWAIELTRSVKDGFRDVHSRLDSIETSQDVQGNTVQSIALRVATIEGRVTGLENRQSTASERVRGESQVNMKQDAAIASIIVKQEEHDTKLTAIEAKTDKQTEMLAEIKGAVVGVITNKKVLFVGKVIFGIAVAYSAAHGLKVVP